MKEGMLHCSNVNVTVASTQGSHSSEALPSKAQITARFLLRLANSSLERDSQKPSQELETVTVQRLGMSLGFCF